MDDFKKLDDKLYYAKYSLSKDDIFYDVWNVIKNNKEILNWAIKVVKDKFGEKDIVNGTAICEEILAYFDDVDKNIYQQLINLIYSNEIIARIVLDGASNGGNSFLLMSLWNPNLKLTKEQKLFAVNEAMNKIGTTRYKKIMDNYSEELDKQGITDDQTIYTEIGDSINPVGAKTGNMYIASIFNSISEMQAHGHGYFDIRYWILKNPNWSQEEKQKLIMDFWYNDEEYDETLEEWEWNIVNDDVNYEEDLFPLIDKSELFKYSYDMLLQFYGNRETTNRIWEEIQFCKLMHQLRPQQWELEFISPRVLKK